MAIEDTISKSINILKADEGLRLRMYKCPAGFNTIGFGHNLDTNPISELAALHILRDDIFSSILDLETIFEGKFLTFPEYQQVALVNMHIQMGPGGFRGFKNMVRAKKDGRNNDAVAAMKDSEWYKIYNTRAKKVIKIFKGDFPI